jgi:glycosidase
MVDRALSEINIKVLTDSQSFHPSPLGWEDQVFYFMMLDRFSDGREDQYRDIAGNPVTNGTTPLLQPTDRGNAIVPEASASKWREAGGKYVGGNLRGLTSKIGYLKRLGVTTIWVSPIFEQVRFQDTYHGYGIQNFLAINHRFGTKDDLQELVRTAHAHGIYVVLDIILNHVGNIFSYRTDRQPRYVDDKGKFDPRWDGQPYSVAGFNDAQGNPTIPFQAADRQNPSTWPSLEAAVWPVEFQNPDGYTQRGRINSWDTDPEFLEGDFFDLKDVHHGQGNLDNYQPSAALQGLIEVYKFWIAVADLDGFRIDTVKHMDLGATRYFASSIHEFAVSIGKEHFFLVGEITGGRQRAFTTMSVTGLDAALGVDEIPQKLEYMVKGLSDPIDYFSLFRNSELVGKESHTWFRDKVVTMFDDHDQVRKGQNKARFCAKDGGEKVVLNALALNALTLGIPCIYYGTEQGFDGEGDGDGADRYLREAMFGGEFGAFRSKGAHCFDETYPIYQELAKILQIRRESKVLCRGRQYLREISGDGVRFGLPQMIGGQIRSIVPWSRILSSQEVVVAINTDYNQPLTVWVTLDNALHQSGDLLKCLYSTNAQQITQTAPVESKNGKAVLIMVPPAGLVIYQ